MDHISHSFNLNYNQLYNIKSTPNITIYKILEDDTLLKNNSFNINAVIIIMLFILPIVIWYFTYKTILPLNRLNSILAKFMNSDLRLVDTIDELKNTKSKNTEIRSLILSVLSSLNKLYKTQNDLIKQKQKTQESDKLKSNFLSNITAQIDRPLNSIINFGDILFKTDLDKVQLNYLNTIIKSSYTLQSTFNDIVDLSKISYGELKLNIKNFKISELMNELENFYRVDMSNKGLKFEISIDNFDREHSLKFDKQLLKKILIKIIDNALKYTYYGYIKLSFEVIKATYENNLVEFNISVLDTGIGIKDEDKLRIINSFDKSHIQYDKKHGPFGMGLSIANKYVKLLNGSIKVASEPSNGSTFTLNFKDISFDKSVDSKELSQRKKKSIVIADGDSKNRVFIQKYLSKSFPQITIQKSSNGYDTIKQCFNTKDQPILIIINLNLRSMDAYKVLEYIRSNNHTDSINIIVIKDDLSDTKKLINFDLLDTINEPLEKESLEVTFTKIKNLLY